MRVPAEAMRGTGSRSPSLARLVGQSPPDESDECAGLRPSRTSQEQQRIFFGAQVARDVGEFGRNIELRQMVLGFFVRAEPRQLTEICLELVVLERRLEGRVALEQMGGVMRQEQLAAAARDRRMPSAAG